MDKREIAEIVGRAIVHGATGNLAPLLAEDCVYISHHSRRHVSGRDPVLKRIRIISENLANAWKSDVYSASVVDLASELLEGVPLQMADDGRGGEVCPWGLILSDRREGGIVAVIVIRLNADGKIQRFTLSRDISKFRTDFLGDAEDSPYDTPLTVCVPALLDPDEDILLEDDRNTRSPEPNPLIYIWRAAYRAARRWLLCDGYDVQSTALLPNSVLMFCFYHGRPYMIYLYAFGKKAPTVFDAEYCWKNGPEVALQAEKREDAVSLVPEPWKKADILYLHIQAECIPYKEEHRYRYLVKDVVNPKTIGFILARAISIKGKRCLGVFPCPEYADDDVRFQYAFNRLDGDVLERLFRDDVTSFAFLTEAAKISRDADIYEQIRQLRKKYGRAKMGYQDLGNGMYNAGSYLKGLGGISWMTDIIRPADSEAPLQSRIHEICLFGPKDMKMSLLEAEGVEPEDLLADVPMLEQVEMLPPGPGMRFSLKAYFANGKCRRYTLTLPDGIADQGDILFRGFRMSDEIWQNGFVIGKTVSPHHGYPPCGPGVVFSNGLRISGYECWVDGVGISP